MAGKSSSPGFAVGLIIGAAIGIVAALLLTPKSGKEVRELLKDKTACIPETIRERTANRERVYKETWEDRKGQPKLGTSYFE